MFKLWIRCYVFMGKYAPVFVYLVFSFFLCPLSLLDIKTKKDVLIKEYLHANDPGRLTELFNIRGIGEKTIRKLEKVCNIRTNENTFIPSKAPAMR